MVYKLREQSKQIIIIFINYVKTEKAMISMSKILAKSYLSRQTVTKNFIDVSGFNPT